MSEIFRHLRPMRYNRDRVTVTPQRNGGVSYLVKPCGPSQYEFWLYICPLNAEFSAKAAVKRLREVAASGVAPWGNFTLGSRSMIDYLVSKTTQTDLPTEVGKLVEMIWQQNYSQNLLKEMIINKKSAKELYGEES